MYCGVYLIFVVISIFLNSPLKFRDRKPLYNWYWEWNNMQNYIFFFVNLCSYSTETCCNIPRFTCKNNSFLAIMKLLSLIETIQSTYFIFEVPTIVCVQQLSEDKFDFYCYFFMCTEYKYFVFLTRVSRRQLTDASSEKVSQFVIFWVCGNINCCSYCSDS